MTLKLTSMQEKKLHLQTTCPTLQQQVLRGGDFKGFAIPGGRAIWWHCPECQGWHVVIQNDRKLVKQ